jgi:hypothetical protein
MAQGYIGQNQIDIQIETDDDFQAGDIITWKSNDSSKYLVLAVRDSKILICNLEDTFEMPKDWYVKTGKI